MMHNKKLDCNDSLMITLERSVAIILVIYLINSIHTPVSPSSADNTGVMYD